MKSISLFLTAAGRGAVALTMEGMEFLGYARQVVQQMELLESRYIDEYAAAGCAGGNEVLNILKIWR